MGHGAPGEDGWIVCLEGQEVAKDEAARVEELDPRAFESAAPYYAVGRPPYSSELVTTMVRELGLDGRGRLLDVGCGPGTLAIALAPFFEEVVALDPEPGMLAEGRRRAEVAGLPAMQWVEGVAEDLGTLDLGTFRLVTFGQSFHRTRRDQVAGLVYGLLEPGGAIAIVTHAVDGRPTPADPGYPPIPHTEVQELIVAFLGGDTKRYLEAWAEPGERFEDTLARTFFGRPRTVYAPGQPDLVRDVDSVVAKYFSMSYAAPRQFGAARDDFEQALRQLLLRRSPQGLFWDWPGETEILIAVKG